MTRAILQPLATAAALTLVLLMWRWAAWRCDCKIHEARIDRLLAHAAGPPPPATATDPVAPLLVQKATMTLFFLLLMGALAAADAFAFENGAVSTISQCWLGMNRKFWFMTFALAFWEGVLLWHVSGPRDPGVLPDPPFWRYALMWTPASWAGLYAGYRWFYQLPDVD